MIFWYISSWCVSCFAIHRWILLSGVYARKMDPHGQRRVLSLQQNRCQTSMRCVHIQNVILLFPWNLADSHWGVLKKHNCRDCSDTQSYLTKQSRPPTSVSAWITAKWRTLIVQCEMICPAWVIDAVTTSGGDHWGFHQHRDIFPTSGLSKEQQTWVNWVKLYSWVGNYSTPKWEAKLGKLGIVKVVSWCFCLPHQKKESQRSLAVILSGAHRGRLSRQRVRLCDFALWRPQVQGVRSK